jgi:hypothetical protein
MISEEHAARKSMISPVSFLDLIVHRLVFASDFVSIRDKAAAKLFGKLSKTDFIILFDKDLVALVSTRRPGSRQIEGLRLRSQQERAAK